MVLCKYRCKPICDFCIHAEHERINRPESMIPLIGGPIGCNLHPDEEHQQIAKDCGYCDDFHCYNVIEEI